MAVTVHHDPGAPYENLANAIVIQAANDYRDILQRLKKYPEDRMAVSVLMETENFFRSAWYRVLTDVDCEYLIRMLREEM